MTNLEMRIDMRPAALACANEACRNMSGVLDLDAMVRHFEKISGLPTKPFVVGPATSERVFHAAGLANMSDMQAVLNAVEAALNELLVKIEPATNVVPASRQPPAYLVWSNEHRAWWGAEQRGYTRVIERAGRYARDEAYAIAAKRGGGWQADSNPAEIALPEADAIAQWRRRAGQ